MNNKSFAQRTLIEAKKLTRKFENECIFLSENKKTYCGDEPHLLAQTIEFYFMRT